MPKNPFEKNDKVTPIEKGREIRWKKVQAKAEQVRREDALRRGVAESLPSEDYRETNRLVQKLKDSAAGDLILIQDVLNKIQDLEETKNIYRKYGDLEEDAKKVEALQETLRKALEEYNEKGI